MMNENSMLLYYDSKNSKYDTVPEKVNHQNRFYRVFGLFVIILGIVFSGLLSLIPIITTVTWNTAIIDVPDLLIIGILGSLFLIASFIGVLSINMNEKHKCVEQVRLRWLIMYVVLLTIAFALFLIDAGIRLKYVIDFEDINLVYYTIDTWALEITMLYILIGDIVVCVGCFSFYVYLFMFSREIETACDLFNTDKPTVIEIGKKVKVPCIEVEDSQYLCQITLDQLDQLTK